MVVVWMCAMRRWWGGGGGGDEEDDVVEMRVCVVEAMGRCYGVGYMWSYTVREHLDR